MKLRWVVVALLAVAGVAQLARSAPARPGEVAAAATPVSLDDVGAPGAGSAPTLEATIPLEPLIISTSLPAGVVGPGGGAGLTGLRVVDNAPGREWRESVRYDPVANPEPGGPVGTLTLTVG